MYERINNNYNELLLLMILIISIGVLLIIISILTTKKKKEALNNDMPELTEDELKKVDEIINKDQLKKDIFNLYKKASIAKSKFNYEILKELLTESLYKEEEQKLKQLKNNNQKLVITNIKLQEIKILSINKQENIELLNIYLHVSEYNYVINNKKELIRGTDDAEYQIEYKIIIEKDSENCLKIREQQCTGKWIKNI